MSDTQRTASSTDKRLGLRVRARRLELGVSQETLAERLGITFQQVQKYEKGVNRIAASRLLDIALALDCSVLRLYGTKGTGEADALGDILDTAEAIELAKAFKRVRSSRCRELLVDLAHEMATN